MLKREARDRIAALASAGSDFAGHALRELRQVYLEIPMGDPSAPVPVRDARVWLADLWAGDRGARVAIDDGTGAVLLVERV